MLQKRVDIVVWCCLNITTTKRPHGHFFEPPDQCSCPAQFIVKRFQAQILNDNILWNAIVDLVVEKSLSCICSLLWCTSNIKEQEHSLPNFIHQSHSPTIQYHKKTKSKPRTRMFTRDIQIKRSCSNNCAFVGISCLCCDDEHFSVTLLSNTSLQHSSATLLYTKLPKLFSNSLLQDSSPTLLHNNSLQHSSPTLLSNTLPQHFPTTIFSNILKHF